VSRFRDHRPRSNRPLRLPEQALALADLRVKEGCDLVFLEGLPSSVTCHWLAWWPGGSQMV